LGGVGHELSINILLKDCEITEGQKLARIRTGAM
jgi:hypothetical protein